MPLSAVFAAATRSVFESPIEYAKVMGQTGQKWDMKDLYRGYGAQVARTTGLLILVHAFYIHTYIFTHIHIYIYIYTY